MFQADLDRKIERGAIRTGLAAADDLSEHEVLYFGVLSDLKVYSLYCKEALL
ncbi:MAG: hypothetical protein WB586_23180 [Chthoniobacterales bacterium]